MIGNKALSKLCLDLFCEIFVFIMPSCIVVPELQRFYARVLNVNDTDNRFKSQLQPPIINSFKYYPVN
jgi:hypothetical protein